jgi:hypothetical protein
MAPSLGGGHDPPSRTAGGSLIRLTQHQDRRIPQARHAEADQASASPGNSTRIAPSSGSQDGGYRFPEDGQLPDLPLYERLIADGVAAADARGSIVDHVTARRLAIWLAARPQERTLARGLVHFIETGEIRRSLRTELRSYVRVGFRVGQPQAARFLQYCAGRRDELGPINEDFGRACDQIDRADVMLEGLRERVRQGRVPAEQVWPDPGPGRRHRQRRHVRNRGSG